MVSFFVMRYYVYILKSEVDDRYYYGQTEDLISWLEYHNLGYSSYTKKFRPWRLYADKEVESRSEAMKLEKKLKNLKATLRLKEFIQRHNFQKLIDPEK